MTFLPRPRFRKVAIVTALSTVLAGLGSAVPASASTWTADATARVAALTPTAGIVTLEWKKQTGDRFTVTEVGGAGPVVRAAALDAASWTSRAETPGSHTYRVTRTPGDGTSPDWFEVPVIVPTRELLVSADGMASAVAPESNASGITFNRWLPPEERHGSPGHASMSPDRKHLAVAFTSWTSADLWLTDIAGTRQKQLTHGAWDKDPDFSPDGRTLAFTRSSSSGKPPAVYLLDLTAFAADPSVEPVLMPGGTDAAMPSWSPAGDAVVVEEHTVISDGNGGQADGGPTGLAVLARTGTRTALAGTSGGQHPSVSRTGRVAFSRYDNATHQGEILVTDLSGAPALRWSQTPPADTAYVFLQPAWDPQGNTIAASFRAPGGAPGSVRPVTIAAAGADAIGWRTADWTGDSTDPSWVDLTDAAPSAVLTAPSASGSSTVSASFTIADSDDALSGLSATCQVDNRVAQPCTPGKWSPSGLAEGSHVLVVRVSDPAGRVGEARRTVVVGANPATRLSDFNKDGFTDLVAQDASGALWVYPGSGVGGFQPRKQMGTGWNRMTALITPGDVTGDGSADVVARDSVGVLWLYPGNGASGLSTRRQIGSGWQSYTVTHAGNLNGTGGPDLLARDSAGVLWLYPFSGNAVFGARTKVGTGWNSYTVRGAGDVSGDGRADILARDSAGALWLYRGNGTGALLRRTLVSSGWQTMSAMVTPGNWDRLGGNDLFTRDTAGRLWFYPGNNAGGFAARRQIGSGWNGYSVY